MAQKVLHGNTRGYTNHPQLTRFKTLTNPVDAVAAYLRYIAGEADRRGYYFDRSRIITTEFDLKIPVTSGQLEYEFQHLPGKLKQRNPELYEKLNKTKSIESHPIFNILTGGIEDWETI